MQAYYEQSDGIPQYIALLEDAQKKAKRDQMPIADAELVMMASAAVLAVQHFPREVDDCEGLPASSRTWSAWKTAFRLAHLKRQRQILASKGGEPLGVAHAAIPVTGKMEAALDNLALAATSDKATVQQLTAANLALTTTVATLTATNKKLVDAAAKKNRVQQQEHLKHLPNSTRTDQCLEDTAGRMDIGSAKVIRARPARTKTKATRTKRRLRTRWDAVRKTRVGIKPDRGG
jgi:hypothetical protein